MKIGKTQKYILKYVQDYPFRCTHTTASQIAETMSESSIYGLSTLIQSFSRLVRNGMITKTYTGKGRAANFAINYNNLMLPKEIMDNAPQHIKDSLREAEEKLKSGEYKEVDEYGAGVVKYKEPQPQPTKLDLKNDETTQLYSCTSLESEPELPPKAVSTCEVVNEAIDVMNQEESKGGLAESSTTASVEPSVTKSVDGKTISINLTINLNL